ncbi:MAG: adenylate/guanylate cyclase domain-containing protein [Alphaproteobacteria bacterium]|nr:adenylate/guanylate cyclase domain-containing protein [Alphaproteobacteria bacterium]
MAGDLWSDIVRREREGASLRAQGALRVSVWAGLVAHVSMAVLFVVLELWPLVAFNVLVSVPCFAVGAVLASRRPLLVGMMALLEVVAHAVFATAVLGASAGFHHWMLLAVVVGGLLPLLPHPRSQVVIPVAGAVLYVALSFVPSADPPPPSWVSHGNFAGMLLALLAVILGYRAAAQDVERALAESQAQSERLLHAMLPASVVQRLQRSPGGLADSHAEVAVLFADVVGFTALSARTSPEVVVDLLNQLFTAFDAETEARGLHKVKTIGDAYMVAGGIPEPIPDALHRIADLALAMNRVVAPFREAHDLRLRIGIHVGPAVAGVIGRSTPAYDLWGDTVNTASRMESHGEAGRIHVSDAAAQRLEGRTLAPRGEIDVKGKGRMTTWWLEE